MSNDYISNPTDREAGQGGVPNVEVNFGTTRETAQPAPAAKHGAKNTKAPAAAAGGKRKMSKESEHTLELISEAFVYSAGSDKPFYHKRSGDRMNLSDFKHYCGKHYGSVVLATEDKDGNTSETSRNSGECWGNPEFPVESRQVVRRVVLEPTDKPESEGDPELFNRWYILKEEMVEPELTATSDSIAPFLRHLMYISDNDAVGVAYFLNWLATLYQYPSIKIPSAILIYSKFGGIGKTKLAELLGRVFGESMVGSCPGSALAKGFDDVIEHKRILMVNEMARSERADNYEKFKSQISERKTSFEGKGRAAKDVVNCTHFIITTNNADALPLMESDRRVLVLRCLAQVKDPEYYEAFDAWCTGPGPALLAGVLATWKFPADWKPYAPVPQTAATRDMQGANKGDIVLMVEDAIERRISPFDADFGAVGDLCTRINNNAALRDQLAKPVNNTNLGKVLAKLFGELRKTRVKRGGQDTALNLTFWRNREFWESATPEARGAHMEHPGLSVLQGGADHGRA